jgi:putative transposase
LAANERQGVRDLLREPRFIDQAPTEVYAELLDQGLYPKANAKHSSACSIRTMYRLLHENGEVKERRRQLRHPVYKKPELIAQGPNQVWSWDITKLMGPAKWTYFYLYVIIDIFSRRVVAWQVADAESVALFKPLFLDAVEKHGVPPGQLTLHADRGASMKAKATALLLADLGVTKSHSRPHTSNDNPFSESLFKTCKYQPQFPQRFGSIQDAKTFCRPFFDWYNCDHHHLGIGLMTPNQVHYGQADEVYAQRQNTLDRAFNANPNRFVKMPPNPPQKPNAARNGAQANRHQCPDAARWRRQRRRIDLRRWRSIAAPVRAGARRAERGAGRCRRRRAARPGGHNLASNTCLNFKQSF